MLGSVERGIGVHPLKRAALRITLPVCERAREHGLVWALAHQGARYNVLALVSNALKFLGCPLYIGMVN